MYGHFFVYPTKIDAQSLCQYFDLHVIAASKLYMCVIIVPKLVNSSRSDPTTYEPSYRMNLLAMKYWGYDEFKSKHILLQ